MSAEASAAAEVTRSGWLTKEGHVVKNWKRRYFVLCEQQLLYFAEPPRSGSGDLGTRLKGSVPLRGASVTTTLVKGRENTFVICNTPNKKNFVIEAESNDDMRMWIDDLREAAFLHNKRQSVAGDVRSTVIVLRQSVAVRDDQLSVSPRRPATTKARTPAATAASGSSSASPSSQSNRPSEVMPTVSFQAMLGTISRCDFGLNGRGLLTRFASSHLFETQQLCALLGSVAVEHRVAVAELVIPRLVDPDSRQSDVLQHFPNTLERQRITAALSDRLSELRFGTA